jgi:pyruvate kinase
MNAIELMVTLWPSFPHFPRFAGDRRLAGIRLNSAMMDGFELEHELGIVKEQKSIIPLWFDIKGRQMRIVEVIATEPDLDIVLNHPISVETPTVVLLKAGADHCLLKRIEGDGRRLVFHGLPRYKVKVGESLHIRHSSLVIHGPLFSEVELAKIEMVKRAGIGKWFLSYVEEQSDIDQFLELIGTDAEVMLKIESKRGLEFVTNEFLKKPNLTLVAARGDLYVEINRPHKIAEALQLIIDRDPEAVVASRLLLSTVFDPVATALRMVVETGHGPVTGPRLPLSTILDPVADSLLEKLEQGQERVLGSRLLLSKILDPVPSCSDFLDIAWLIDVGYRRMMLCDELCLKEELLSVAVNAFDAFRNDYKPNG